MAAEQGKLMADYLAKLVLEIRQAPLSALDRAIVRQHLFDSVASAFIGARSSIFRDLVSLTPLSDSKSANDSTPAEQLDLAMCWAFATNGSVYEDGSREGACHPAAAVMPVVLACAGGKSWENIEKSIVAGYDVMVRLARCGNPQFARKGFHATAVTAPFGAAATLASLLNYDFDTTRQALCLAAMGSSGLMASFKQGSTQPLQVAWGVRNGLAAALLAGKGNQGYPRILEEGFLPAYLGLDVAATASEPLEYALAIQGCYMKPYPGCRHMHASLDAFDTLMTDQHIDVDQIHKISVGTYSIAISTGIKTLESRGDAYFNIPYAIAARALLGRSDYDSFDEKHFTNPRLQQLMQKVSVTVDPEIESRYPLQRGSRVEVMLKNRQLMTSVVASPLGEPEKPLSAVSIRAKFLESINGAVSPEEGNKIEWILTNETGQASIGSIATLLIVGCHGDQKRAKQMNLA